MGFIRRGYYYIKEGVREHTHVFEQFHKCCMLKWGVVHHKDGNKLNNKIENLEGMTLARHTSIHNKGKQWRLGMKNSAESNLKRSMKLKGHKAWNQGMKYDDERKEQEKYHIFNEDQEPWNKGQKGVFSHSPETRKRISETMKKVRAKQKSSI